MTRRSQPPELFVFGKGVQGVRPGPERRLKGTVASCKLCPMPADFAAAFAIL